MLLIHRRKHAAWEISYIFTSTTTKQIVASFHRSLEVWDLKEEWFFWRQVEAVAGLRGAGKGMSKQYLGPEWWDTGNGNRTLCPALMSTQPCESQLGHVRVSEDPGDNGCRLPTRSISVAESEGLVSITTFVSVPCLLFENGLNRSVRNLYLSSRLFPHASGYS